MAKPGQFRRRSLGEAEGTQEAREVAKRHSKRFTGYSDTVDDLHDMIDFNVEKGPRVKGERDYGHRSTVPKLTTEEASHPLIKQIREEAKAAASKRQASDTELMARTEAGHDTTPSKVSLDDDFERSVEKKKAAQRAALQVEEDTISARRQSNFAKTIKDGIKPEPTQEPKIMATKTTPPPNKDLEAILKRAAEPSPEKRGKVAYVRDDFKPPTAKEITEAVKTSTNKSVGSAKYVGPSHMRNTGPLPISEKEARKVTDSAHSSSKDLGKMVRDTGTKTFPNQKGEIAVANRGEIKSADLETSPKQKTAWSPPKADDLMASVEPAKSKKGDRTVMADMPNDRRRENTGRSPELHDRRVAEQTRRLKARHGGNILSAFPDEGLKYKPKTEGGVVSKAVNAVNEAAGTAARTAGQTLSKYRPEWMAKTGRTVKDLAMPAIEKASASGAGKLAGKVAARLTPVGAAAGLGIDAYTVGKAGVEGVKAVREARSQARDKASSESKYGTPELAAKTRQALSEAKYGTPHAKNSTDALKQYEKRLEGKLSSRESEQRHSSETDLSKEFTSSSTAPTSVGRDFSDLPKSSTPAVAKAKAILKGISGANPDVGDKSIKTGTLAKNKEYIARLKKEADEYRLKRFKS